MFANVTMNKPHVKLSKRKRLCLSTGVQALHYNMICMDAMGSTERGKAYFNCE